HALAHRSGRIVVVRGTALEERHGHICTELAQSALYDLPDTRVVRRVADDEDTIAGLDVPNEWPAEIRHVPGYERSQSSHRHLVSRAPLPIAAPRQDADSGRLGSRYYGNSLARLITIYFCSNRITRSRRSRQVRVRY